LGESSRADCLGELLISLDVPCTDLEVRVWISDQTDLHVSTIEIKFWQDEPKTGDADPDELVRNRPAKDLINKRQIVVVE
jgi:hypothetical protein